MIYNHPISNIQVVYKWYILPIGGLYGSYHLLREPGNSIDLVGPKKTPAVPLECPAVGSDRINGDRIKKG